MHELVRVLQRIGFNLCGVYCVDCTFLTDGHKFVSANLMALAAMNNLATPHINVLTKCDMIKDKAKLESLLDTEPSLIIHELSTRSSSERFRSLNEAIGKVVNEFNLVQFHPLDLTDEESIQAISYTIDAMLQYGENLEPKDVDEMDLDR
jgi:hypothetical protein